jgi:hypothetical protein
MQHLGLDPVKLSTTSIDGENYVNCGLCYGTRATMVVASKEEGKQVNVVKEIQRTWCKPHGHSIETLHSDSATIFLCAEMKKYMLDNGIRHDCSSPYQHAHNLVEGGCIRILLNRARVLLTDAGLPPRFAVYSIKHAAHTWNAMVHPASETKTPLEKITGRQPDISGLRPFGALAYYFVTKEERNLAADPRWAEKASRGILLGYSDTVEGGYLVYPGRNKRIITRTQVVVIETKVSKVLPAYADRFLIDDPLTADEMPPSFHPIEGIGESPTTAEPAGAPPSPPSQRTEEPRATTPPSHRHDHSTRQAARIGERAMAVAEACAQECTCGEQSCDACVRAGSEQAALAAADSANNDNGSDSDASFTSCSDSPFEPVFDPQSIPITADIPGVFSLEHTLVGFQGERSDLVALPINPRSMTEALRGPQAHEWRLALEKERDSCLETFSYVEVREVPARSVRAVMAFRVSRKTDGSLKFRARLCPDGGSQVRWQDYDDSYSPTVRRGSILMVLHIAAAEDWDIEHVDIGNAYKETLTDDRHPLHMRLSAAMVDFGFAKSTHVRLNCNFWGTKEAGQRWYSFISFIVQGFGLRRSGDDPCQFELNSKDTKLILVVLIYVDDVLITGSWTAKIYELIAYVRSHFNEVKVESVAKFVGMQVTRHRERREVHVHLSEYAQDLVSEFVPDHVLGSSTPLYSTVDYRNQPAGAEEPIWAMTGKLRYMADATWWDLQVASSLLASAGATPNKTHRRGVQKCLQYVKERQSDHALVLGGMEPVDMFAYADASYTAEGDSRYQFGYALFLSPMAGAYTVESKRSTTVSHSSCQSEIKAIDNACREIVPNREQLAVLGFPQLRPTRLYTDSKASVDLVSNVFQMRPTCRHFNRDINWIRQCVQLGQVELVFVPTDENPADLMTKILGPDKHVRFTRMLLAGVGLVAVAALYVNGLSM